MQQVKIDPVGLEPLQAALAGLDHALLRGVVRQHLADDEQPVAMPGDGAADDLLGGAAAVHLGRVDQIHAEVDAELQGGLLVGGAAAVLAHMPGAEAEGRHAFAIRQRDAGHCFAHRISPVRARSRRRKTSRAAP